MAYSDYSAIESLRGITPFTAKQQTQATAMLTHVSSEIDGWLGSIFVVPFSATYPNLVVTACELMSLGWFIMGTMVDQPQVEAIERRANAYLVRGQAIIEAILANPALLEGTTAQLRTDADTTHGPKMRVTSSPPSITLQDSSTWRRPTPSSAMATQLPPKEYP